ncbi:hypothetical protein OJF2_57690 [Aquisphaera giovannonii]|uniref:Uncharacterized protein n=1 Tax=Aquisphaera giovannonii TaxID=406548 RepID=A0A5B9W9C1_9BACT|nr:hypothetical protein [Aquisphaera giovannonii]QEH37182.1 hypothetical protein OJF2_57690 [Aquisphaera giovannonii]
MDRRIGARLEGYFWLVVLVVHAIAAAAGWWLRAGGFPWDHPRFWLHRGLPAIGLGWTLAGLVALHRRREGVLALLLPAYPAAWGAAAVTAKSGFPITFRTLWLAPLAASAVMSSALILLLIRAAERRSWPLAIVAAAASAILGSWMAISLRADPPGTHPRGEATAVVLPEPAQGGVASRPPGGLLRLGPDAAVYASEGSIIATPATLKIEVHPLLRFLSLSPDGCWVVFNTAMQREGPEPRLDAVREAGEGVRELTYRFPGVGSARMIVTPDRHTRWLYVDAATTIDRDVDSHLNSYCDVEVRGHRRLSLSFSPCDWARIEVLPFGYPSGRPLRFAYVDEARRFVVAEAASGEKGPFRTLAEGYLRHGEPLTITFYDEDRASGRVTLRDWSTQLDTGLLPTAGWGVPNNAIEFSLSSPDPASPASVFATLAATSVGRGWDCVGHASGTYRNRVEIGP